jgi:Domain of unknown function (DUF4304)
VGPLGGNAQEMFNSILRNEIAPMLRAHGWKGSGKHYKCASDPYRAFIEFEKSVDDTKDEVAFTANLGVLNDDAIAERLQAWERAREQWGHDVVVIPTWGEWETRIGFLLPIRSDKWWWLLTGRSPDRKVAELREAFSEFALPVMETQMKKSRVEPSFIVETRGRPLGPHVLEDGNIRWHNVGGERLYPVDTLLDAVDREYFPPLGPAPPEVPVDFNVTRPDGCVSLELDVTRDQLAATGVRLTEGMPLILCQGWTDPKGLSSVFELLGEADYDEQWGWGAEVSPKLRSEIVGCLEGRTSPSRFWLR